MDSSGNRTVKMEFFFKMIEEGWTVWKLDDRTYNFQRPHGGQVETYDVGEFLQQFICKITKLE